MSVLLYNLGFVLLAPAIATWLFARLFLQRRSRSGWHERLGFAPRFPESGLRIWLHAVSAGEMVAAAPVVRALQRLRPDAAIVVSTITPGGLAQARRLIREAQAVFYFPIDFWPFVRQALARVRPTLFVAVETELWPNFLHAAARAGIPAAIVNGRFSDRTLRRLGGSARLLQPLYARTLRLVGRLAMQTPADGERAVALGADRARVLICGNTKFDQEIATPPPGEQEALREAFGLQPDQPLWIAGSTHPGEEEQVLAAWKNLLADLPDLALMIAPRHIERAAAVASLCREIAPEHPLVCRSALRARATCRVQRAAFGGKAGARSTLHTSPPRSGASPIILLDTLGELAGMYALASVVFVGGSLVPVGGHDVLQPLFHGKPTFFGPHMHNQRDLAQLSLGAGAARQIAAASDLAEAVRRVLTEPVEALKMASGARSLLNAHRGAADRCAAALLDLM